MVLTTPESAYFDQKHKEYEHESESDKSFERYQADTKGRAKDSNVAERRYDTDTILNDIHGNSTEERKQSTYLNQAELESTNYDVSASETRNRTETNTTNSGEKKGKFMQDGSHVNLTLPSASEVWALASMKNVEHSKNQQGQFYNVTEEVKDPEDSNNGTLATKQLADWASVAKNNDFTNSSYAATNYTNNFAKVRERIAELVKNFSRTSPRPYSYRGRFKYQNKPLTVRDHDSSSQENQIIAVRMTTLPPPIVVMRTTTIPTTTDSENESNESTISFTDMVTDIETTTPPSQSQNELKTKFRIKNVTRPVETEFETTTTEIEQKTQSSHVDEMPTTTQAFETTTLFTTMQPDDTHTTTEQEFQTTNRENLETDSITEIDEDSDQSTHVETTISAGTENEILESQSSTLLPQYVETKKPTTESEHTTTESVAPTTEFIGRKETKELESSAELTTTIVNLNRDEYKYSTVKSRVVETTQNPQSIDPMPVVIDETSQRPSTDSQVPDIGEYSGDQPDTNTIIAVSISVVGIVVIGVVIAVLLVLRKRKKQLTYGQRCRPVGLDAYSLDNVSVYNSVRRKGMLRMSKRSYGNAAFDDPGLKNNLLTGSGLAAFAQKRNEIFEEFKELPAVTARVEEVPVGCEDKNR